MIKYKAIIEFEAWPPNHTLHQVVEALGRVTRYSGVLDDKTGFFIQDGMVRSIEVLDDKNKT